MLKPTVEAEVAKSAAVVVTLFDMWSAVIALLSGTLVAAKLRRGLKFFHFVWVFG